MNIYKINPFRFKKAKGFHKDYLTIITDGYIFNYYFKFYTNYEWIIVSFYKKNDLFEEKPVSIYFLNDKNNYSYYKSSIRKAFYKFVIRLIKNKLIEKIKSI